MERTLEEKGVAFQAYVECRQLPERLANLLLLERKGTALLQSAEESSAEGNGRV